MQIPVFTQILLIIIPFICSIGFVVASSEESELTMGRPLTIGASLFWFVVPVVAQGGIMIFAFHPVSYLICMGLVILMEILTIRRPNGVSSEEQERPSRRFLAWVWFAFSAEISGIIAGAYREDEWAFQGRNILLYLVPIIVTVMVGLICVALCGKDENEDKKEDENEGTSDDDDDTGSVDEIDASDLEIETDDDDDEDDELDEPEDDDIDDDGEAA